MITKEKALKYRVPTFKIKMVRDNRGGELLSLDSHVAAQVLNFNIGDLPYEEVWILTVNACSQITGAIKIGQGGVHGCALLPRDVLTPVITSGASGFILGHNHPSGDPTPSREDLALTQSIHTAASAVSVPLLDHIIVSSTMNGMRFKSMFEMGLFNEY